MDLLRTGISLCNFFREYPVKCVIEEDKNCRKLIHLEVVLDGLIFLIININMPVIDIDGFKAYKEIDGKVSIIVNSNYIEDCKRIYINHNLSGVIISISHNYELLDVDFLADYPNIERLQISDGIKDINAIHTQHNLKSLFVTGKKKKIDFSALLRLEVLDIDWSPLFPNMDRCKRLERSILRSYNPNSKDFSNLPSIVWIKSLEFVQSTIRT